MLSQRILTVKYYMLVTGLCVLFAACQKDLLEETPKSPTLVNYYKTGNDLNMAATGLYAVLNPAFNAIGSEYYGGDDATVFRKGNKIEFSDFDTFGANSSNSRMTGSYANHYAVIKSCNALINNYANAEASDIVKNNAAGQAYFLRALSYFFLTRIWGAIPMPLDNTVSYNLPKSQPADIYKVIVSDLEKAEAMLPDTWTGLQNQHGVNIAPTKGTAKALLANVYLTMAGWPLKQTDKYALAAAKAKEVIDNKAKYGFDLLSNVASLWKKEFKYNKETVFGCYFNNAVPNAPWNQVNMMGPFASQAGDEGGWDDYYGEINFYNNFPAGPRKDATYQMVYIINNQTKDWTGTAAKHPYFFKYRDDESYDPVTHKASNWITSRTTYVIRYAEVLLTYAEAKAMSGQLDQTAYDAIDQVRLRAGLPKLTSGLTSQQFRDSVIAEKGWEFAGMEAGVHWFDLVRTETVSKANSNRNAAEEPLKNVPNDTQHTYYWAPIPVNDQLLNPNL